jgi:hypothetical protein
MLEGLPLKLSVPLLLAALEPPSKPYANRIVQSFLCNSLETEVIKRLMRTGIHPALINHHLVVFIQHDPVELRGL